MIVIIDRSRAKYPKLLNLRLPAVSFASLLTYSNFFSGINIRQKSKELVELIQDDERLREERRKARKNKDKYIGLAGT